jgi:hypothetical protein
MVRAERALPRRGRGPPGQGPLTGGVAFVLADPEEIGADVFVL